MLPKTMKYFSILEPDLEPKYKLISQRPPGYDPGDTCHREGMFMIGAFILFASDQMDADELFFIQRRYRRAVDLLNDPKHPGLLRRYPDPSYWGGQSDCLSRDQATSNVIAMAFLPTKTIKNPSTHLWDFYLAHIKRGLLFMTNTKPNGVYPNQTIKMSLLEKMKFFFGWRPKDSKGQKIQVYATKLPDLTILSFWSLYIRSFECLILYPLLWLFDLDLLVTSLIKIHQGKDKTESDDLNHILSMYQAEITMPTLWSKLAFWVYKNYRPYPFQFSAIHPMAKNPMQAVMNYYFRGYPEHKGPKLELVFEDVNNYMHDTFKWTLRGKFRC